MSFVRNGESEPNIEIWWDAIENKIDVVRGRNVSCYLKIDPTQETEYVEMGKSNANKIVRDNVGADFDGVAISTRLRSRDLTLKKGQNVRITAFHPEFQPTGTQRNIVIRYLLDGRLSNPTGADATWDQNLAGETKGVGMIKIHNQGQYTDRILPKIKYSRGESIAFEVLEETLGLKANFMGMSIDFIVKERSKGKTIGA